MLVSVLASGSEGNSTYIKMGNTNILIDLGMNYKYISEKLEELNVSPSAIDYVFITHTHSDHTGAMKQFLKCNHPKVFMDPKMLSEIEFMSEYPNICFDDDVINLGEIKAEVFKTSHDAPGSRGYIFYFEDESVVYITDTGYINQKLFSKLYNHSIYIFESNHDIELLMHGSYPSWLKRRISSDKGHLSNSQTAFYLSKLIGPKTKKIILAHLSKENNDPDLALQTVKEGLISNNIKFNDIECAKQKEKTDCVIV